MVISLMEKFSQNQAGLCKWCIWLLMGMVVSLPVWGQTRDGQAGSGILSISAEDELQILNDARLRRVGDYYLATGCDDPLQVRLNVVDLNRDRLPEVVLQVTGSPCFSGVMHSNVSVYVRSSRGKWREVLGFVPAFSVRVLPARNRGYADLALTVLGGCDPVYRWAGASYLYMHRVSAYEDKECQGGP